MRKTNFKPVKTKADIRRIAKAITKKLDEINTMMRLLGTSDYSLANEVYEALIDEENIGVFTDVTGVVNDLIGEIEMNAVTAKPIKLTETQKNLINKLHTTKCVVNGELKIGELRKHNAAYLHWHDGSHDGMHSQPVLMTTLKKLMSLELVDFSHEQNGYHYWKLSDTGKKLAQQLIEAKTA